MSKALYRKYRSKKLSEIVGQEHITSTLSNSVKKGKVSHAYLFTGPRGVGKTSIARILAHEINQIDYLNESLHMDIIEIDAASNRRIDEIRDLREKVYIAPTTAKYKVYIIDEVHMLTKEAFNALLKTLEEPPKHVVFILATTEIHKLPDTIISRTQRFTFKPIKPELAVSHLASIAKSEGIKIDKNALEILALHGNGSFRDSISLLDQVGSIDKKISKTDVEQMIGIAPDELIENLLDDVLDGKPSNITKHMDELVNNGVSPSKAAKQLSAKLRQLIMDDGINQTGLDLLKNLLEVGSSPEPLASLEITLLRANLEFNKIKPTEMISVVRAEAMTVNKPSRSEPVKESTAKEIIMPQETSTAQGSGMTKSGDITPGKDIDNNINQESVGELSEWWDSVLRHIKSSNNTLHGILRMANTELDGHTLNLIFKFPFHKKKVSDPTTLSKIQQAIKETTGYSISLNTIHNKDYQPVPSETPSSNITPGAPIDNQANQEPTDSTPENIDLNNITNIFGGGEVMES